MATTTYCVQSDVEAVLSEFGLSARVDDDRDDTIGTTEALIVTAMIRQAAGRMNSRLQKRYKLSDLVDNDWCKDTNAWIAARNFTLRRGGAPPTGLETMVQELFSELDSIRDNDADVPDISESFEAIPTVSNFTVEPFRRHAKVRVIERISTGEKPAGNRKRFPSGHRHIDPEP